MSIRIKAVAIRNPRDLTAPLKYYAKAVNTGEVSLDSMSTSIAQMSTVSKADVYAVLIALTEHMPRQLGDGKIIRLGSLGSFVVSVKSEPSDTARAVGASNVKKLKLNFSPSKELKRELEGFTVQKIT